MVSSPQTVHNNVASLLAPQRSATDLSTLDKILSSIKMAPKSLPSNTQAAPQASILRVGEQQVTKFYCEKCREYFVSAQSLGGHISRQHPNSSEQYKKKMERRKEREFERQLLFLAKQEHMRQFGEATPLNRVKIRRFKKEIRRQMMGSQMTLSSDQ